MLLHGIRAFGQGIGHGYAVFARFHAADQRFALIYVKSHAADRCSVQGVRLGQANLAHGRRIFHPDFVHLFVLRAFDCGGKSAFRIVRGRFRFGNCVFAISQQAADSLAPGIRGQGGDRLACGFAGDGELRASQRFMGQAIGFDDFHPELNRLILHLQFGDFAGFDGAIQRGKRAGITGRQRVFLHSIISLGQVPGNGNARFVGGHAADQRVALINVKDHAGNGAAVQLVRFYHTDAARHGLILRFDHIGFPVFCAVDGGGKAGIHIVGRHFGFPDLIFTIPQQATGGFALGIGGQGGGNSASCLICDGELRSGQWFMGQGIRFNDLHGELNRLIVRVQIGYLPGFDRTIQTDQIASIAGRQGPFSHDITSFGQIYEYSHAGCVGGHGAHKGAALVDVENDACNGASVCFIRFGDTDAALHGAVFGFDHIGFPMFRAVDCYRKTTVNIAAGNGAFRNVI